MADLIEKEGFGKPELLASSGGAFEVKMEGHLLFSKLKERRFPDDAEVLDLIKKISG